MNRRQFTFDEVEIGHTFSPLTYPVDEQLIREYADTLGDENPLRRDLSCAGAAGYRAILAPPAIAALYVLKAYRTGGVPPSGGVLLRQRFKFYRPIMAGDVLFVQPWVADKYVKHGRRFLVIDSLARNRDGEDVAWAESTSFWAD